MIYVFHGDDAFTRDETVAGLRARMAADDPAAAAMNDITLAGRSLTVAELAAAANTVPFLGSRRLVVVQGLLGRCNPTGAGPGAKALAAEVGAYLPTVPDTTRLVFSDDRLAKGNPILKALAKAAKEDKTVVVRQFDAPKAAVLPRWLVRRSEAKGGSIARDAAVALAEALNQEGTIDLRLADQELNKLLTYSAGTPITVEAVRLLVAPVATESIFAFVDALAERRGPRAITLLHEFLDAGETPLRLLALIARQIRLLALTKGMVDDGRDAAAIQSALPVPAFVARKLLGQSRRFSLSYLTMALKRLAEIDAGIKTGRTEPVVALDLFVAAICGTHSRNSFANAVNNDR